MSRWFRHYAGMMRDEKLVRVAVKAKQSIERVCWVWGALLESASEVQDGGRYDFDADEASYFLRCDVADVGSILDGLEACGRIGGGMVVRWGDRQFDSDSSRERQRRYREKRGVDRHKRKSDGDNMFYETPRDGGVTSPQRHADGEVTLQEAETDTETETDSVVADARAREPPSPEPEVTKGEEYELTLTAGKALAASPNLFVMATPMAWKRQWDWKRDIIPAIRAAVVERRPGSIHSWDYFSPIIADWHAKRTKALPQGRDTGHAPRNRTTAELAREFAAHLRAEETSERDGGDSFEAHRQLSRA